MVMVIEAGRAVLTDVNPRGMEYFLNPDDQIIVHVKKPTMVPIDGNKVPGEALIVEVTLEHWEGEGPKPSVHREIHVALTQVPNEYRIVDIRQDPQFALDTHQLKVRPGWVIRLGEYQPPQGSGPRRMTKPAYVGKVVRTY